MRVVYVTSWCTILFLHSLTQSISTCALWTVVGVSLFASSRTCGQTSLPTHESISSFDVYLVKLHLVPNVARPLVLANEQGEHEEVTFEMTSTEVCVCYVCTGSAFSHTSIRFLLSFRSPLRELDVGYSGSGVPLGVMYILPPPRIT